MPRSTYASVSITACDATFNSEDLRTATKEDLAEITLETKALMARVLKQGGLTIEEFEPIEVVKLDGFYGLQVKYQRTGPKGSVLVTMTRYVVNGKEISINISYRKKESAIWKPTTTFISKSVHIHPIQNRENKAQKAELKMYVSKDFGFVTMFPAKVKVTSFNNALGPIKAFAAIDFSEKDERATMYQIIAHRITKMKNSPAESEKETYELIQASLDSFIKSGGGYDYTSEKSKIASWPTIKFKCKHKDFFKEGVVSYKYGFAFLRKDTYFKVLVHGIKDNKELKDASHTFFGIFSFADAKTLKQAEQDAASDR